MSDSDDYEQAKLMLILKHGSMEKAFQDWREMSLEDQRAISQFEFELLLEYEYRREYGGFI